MINLDQYLVRLYVYAQACGSKVCEFSCLSEYECFSLVPSLSGLGTMLEPKPENEYKRHAKHVGIADGSGTSSIRI